MAKRTGGNVSTETAVAPKQQNLPAVNPLMAEFAGDQGQGFERTTMNDYAVPFLMILQKMSPQCDEDQPGFIPGAKPGLFLNTATGKLYETVTVVPAAYQNMFSEWVPRESGGGFRGHHMPGSPEVLRAASRRDERGRFQTDRGTHLMDTRYHFLIVVEENGQASRAVLALSSTQIKKSKLWMSAMRNIEMTAPDGRKFTPPMFSHLYRLSTETEKKDEYTWKGIKIDVVRPLNADEISLYKAAKEFRAEIEAGKIDLEEAQEKAAQAGSTDEVPF